MIPEPTNHGDQEPEKGATPVGSSSTVGPVTEPENATHPLWGLHFNNPYGPDQAAVLPLLRRLVGVFEDIERDFDQVYLRALLITQDLLDEHGRGTLPLVAIFFEGIKRNPAGAGWPWEAVTLVDLEVGDSDTDGDTDSDADSDTDSDTAVAVALARAAGLFLDHPVPNGIAAVVLTQPESTVDGPVVRTDVFRSG